MGWVHPAAPGTGKFETLTGVVDNLKKNMVLLDPSHTPPVISMANPKNLKNFKDVHKGCLELDVH